ncbi:hypothetical protein [Natronomonas marina]|jgi:FlaG/FlaF family flagellin (archaellin)|uniref:hypothetical protein n=1 Tax=Natronomonas marina TaxID=2961939 RepID=UPI0020C9F3C4|nr:hypothetical protein [Natronomonas marina]
MIERLRADERGVSEVIGAILVFGILITLLAILQTQAIPAANQKVEFNHNQELQSDFVNFNTAMSEVAVTGTPKSVKIQMGTTYPSRLLFFNPDPPGGEIRSAGNGSVSIYNINATDEHTRDYVNGSMTNLTSRRLEYDPTYNEYDEAPVTVLEYGTVYRDFGNTTIVDDETNLVRGNTISLMLLNGNLSQGQSTALSLEAQATSAPARTVTIEPDQSGQNITINVPTRLNASQWEEMLADADNVRGVVQNGSRVEVRLNGTKAYNLRVPQVGVGNGVPDPNATYVTRSSNRQLQIDQANILPVEVRDRYNNPVSGESVNITVDSGSFNSTGTQSVEANTTDDGRPAVSYFGGPQGVVEVNASYEGDPADPSYDFDPENDPEDINMLVTFDPRLDDEKPTLDNVTVTSNTYDVCTTFGDVNIPVISDTILSCTLTSDATTISVNYKASDTGGSGLDYIELGVNDSSTVLLNKTHQLQGSSDSGTFFTPQIRHDLDGEPAAVNITVYDRNGNRVSESEDL